MKRCPQCSNTYPDSERFCSADGTQLVPVESGGRPTQQMPPAEGQEPTVECPVCGGKALPGEELCSFCGARLNVSEPPPQQPSFTIPRQTVYHPTQEQIIGGPSFDDDRIAREERSGAGRMVALAGYALAAIIALAAGAWFAIHLTRPGTPPKTAALPSAASPAASPALSGPIAQLADKTPVQVTGESATDPARNVDAASKVFKDNSSAVLEVYKKALDGDSKLADGALASLTVNPAGDVIAGSIKTSTAPNPALDAELVKTMMGWHFTPFGGGSVEVSYPVVMAPDSASRDSVETALADKVAHLSSGETPEYASAPAPAPSAAAPPSPAPEASPALASREPIAPPIPPEAAPAMPETAPAPPRARRHPRAIAPPPPPRVSLLTRVQDRLRSDRRLGRVKAYTNGGGVVTLYGKVFDDKARRLAVSTARSVDGVTDVIDSLQTDTSVWARQEAAIAAQLQGAGLSQVTVKVIGKDAYLSGQVSTEAEKEHAVTIAEAAAPVRVRTNLIRVVPKGIFSF